MHISLNFDIHIPLFSV